MSFSPSRKTPPGTPPVEAFGETHCVIDQSNLFVSATLEDELLLLNAPEGALTRLQEICVRFGFQPEPKRPFSSYSGGEQAILCYDVSLSVYVFPFLALLRSRHDGSCYAYAPKAPSIALPAEQRGTLLEELALALRSHVPENCICLRCDLAWRSQ